MVRIFFITALRTGVPFGVLMGFFFGVVSVLMTGDVRFGVIGPTSGLIAGVLFGILMAGFVAFWCSSAKQRFRPAVDEIVVKDGPANLRHKSPVLGWLTVTNRRLVFHSNAFSMRPSNWSAPLVEIERVEVCAIVLFKTGVQVETLTEVVRFDVFAAPHEWVNAIIDAVENAKEDRIPAE